jgi:hypothetical protein
VFTAMVVGMIAQTGSKTVCGMLAGAGLAQTWSHDRVHRFFARAVWSIDAVGLIVLNLIATHLVDADAVIVLAVDDTAHRRRGKKVHGASWIHDGSAPGRNKLAFGHRWVVVGVVVRLPFMTRPVCLPPGLPARGVPPLAGQGNRLHRGAGLPDGGHHRRPPARPAHPCRGRRRLPRQAGA